MKKLLFAIGCIFVMLITPSCSTDSYNEIEMYNDGENPAITPPPPPPPPVIDDPYGDKDKDKG